MDIVPYGGWQRCLRMHGGGVELVATLEVGPRIIRFGTEDGPNELVEYPAQMGLTGGDDYRSYGGHRLWTAPEDEIRTYEADNAEVEMERDGPGIWIRCRAGASGLARSIRVEVDSEGGVALLHEVVNRGTSPQTIAPWCLTVMAPGGTCVFPQAEPVPHPDGLLPARPLVLWPYTEMADPRWTWGNRVVRLRHDPERGPQKVGALIRQGIAVYENHGNVFVKRFPCLDGTDYPDFQCNFETFTRHDMLEVESLGPLVTLAPGDSITHPESWYLLRDTVLPSDDEECGRLLKLWQETLL